MEHLAKNDVDGSISVAMEVAKDSRISVFSTLNSKQSTFLDLSLYLDSIAAYYSALATRKLTEGDDLAALTYLGASWALAGVVDTSIIPVLSKYATEGGTDSMLLEKTHAELWNDITSRMSSLMGSLRSKGTDVRKAETDKMMQNVVDAALSRDTRVRELAVSLGQKFPAGDFKQARKLYEFVRDDITYIRDPLGLEYIQRPDTTLRVRSGDCEDKSILLTAMLAALGFEPALIFADSDHDQVADHVYAAVHIPSAPDYCKSFPSRALSDGKDLRDWIALDPTYEDCEFGMIPIDDLEISKFVFLSPAKAVVES